MMDRIRDEFIDIVEWPDDSRDTLVWRLPRYPNEIKGYSDSNVKVRIS